MTQTILHNKVAPFPTQDSALLRDLRQSLYEKRVERVAETLSALPDLLPDDQAVALRLARLTVNAADEDALDAAFWRAAEKLYATLGGVSKLRDEPILMRVAVLSMAVQSTRAFLDVLYGHVPCDQVVQALADFLTHKESLVQLQRREAGDGRQ